MKVLVCGGRNYGDKKKLFKALDGLDISLLIQGGAYGADSLAGTFADTRGIHQAIVLPLWDKFGKSAGIKRNEAMLSLDPDYCVAFPGGRGTADMVKRCLGSGITVYDENLEEL